MVLAVILIGLHSHKSDGLGRNLTRPPMTLSPSFLKSFAIKLNYETYHCTLNTSQLTIQPYLEED